MTHNRMIRSHRGTKRLCTGRNACATLITTALLGIFTLFGAVNAHAGNWTNSVNRNLSWGSPYIINTEKDLAQFAYLVNSGNSFQNQTITLGADIDMSAHFWTPAGTINRTLLDLVPTSERPFLGTFDGNDKTITGIAMDPDGTLQYGGLFGYVGRNGAIKGTVKNVTVDKIFSFASSRWSSYAGGIVGYNCGVVENCNVNGTKSLMKSACIIMDSVSKGTDLVEKLTAGKLSLTLPEFNFAYAGGVVGFNDGGTVAGCTNNGTVNALAWTTIACAGGVVGCNATNDNFIGTVTDCVNNGKVNAKSTDILTEVSVGVAEGIEAVLEEINSELLDIVKNMLKDMAKDFITKIFNKAVQEAVDANMPIPNISIKVVINYSYAGGVVGMNEKGLIINDSNSGIIDADSSTCSSISEIIETIKTVIAIIRLVASWGGDVSAWGDITISAKGIDIDAHAGGAAGWNNGTVDSCSNTGYVDGYCFNLDFTSMIMAAALPSYAGGMVGYNVNGTIKNCSNSGNLNSKSENGILTILSAGNVVAHSGGMSGKNQNGVIENSYNSGQAKAYSLSVSLGSSYTYARAGGVAGINDGSSSRIENCMSRGATYANWFNATISFWVYFSAGSFSEAGGVVGENKKDSIVKNCYWKKNKTDGFNRNAIGSNKGSQKDCLYFDAAPGTLSGTVGGSKNLRDVLDYWVTSQANQGTGYLRWGVVGYPVLARPVTVIFDSNGGSTPSPISKIVTLGLTYETLPTVTKPGWSFAGWRMSPNGGALVTSSTPVTSDTTHTLYAHWVQDWSMYATDLPQPVGNTYTLTTEGELAALMVSVNGGVNFSGKTFVLANDLVMTNYPWIPAGTGSAYPFRGTFDGNGHTISGITISGNRQYAGLFGYIGTGGQVKNVTLTGVTINVSYPGTVYVGGIAGYNAGSTSGLIENCTVSGTVTGSVSSGSYYAYVGGIVGYNLSGGVIQGCINNGTVNATSASSSAYAGGIAGYKDGGTVANCSNSGSVTANSSSSDARSGGIAGYTSGTIQSCSNSGAVKATHSTTSIALIGGISGYNTGIIENCINSKALSTSQSYVYIGGITGYNVGGTVRHCRNTAGVSATGTSPSVGGVVGYHFSGTITYCQNNGMITATAANTASTPYAGGVAGVNKGTITYCVNGNAINAISPYDNPDYSCAGGMAGYNGLYIADCSNSGYIYSSSEDMSCSGGMVGWNDCGTIQDCTNSGTVEAYAYEYSGWQQDCDAQAGGMVGYSYGGFIVNCSNRGNVTATGDGGGSAIWSSIAYAHAGGIVGVLTGGNGSTISDTGTIENCLSLGEVNSSAYNIHNAGHLVGTYQSGTIDYCYWKHNNTAGFNIWVYGNNKNGKPSIGASFDGAPGTISSVKVNEITATNPRDALNYWVSWNGGSPYSYSGWSVVPGVNGGYPFLQNSFFTTFDGNGGNPLTQTLAQTPNTNYILPSSNPTRTGYTFKGWFTAATNGAQITSSINVPAAPYQTLYAQWTANTYSVAYNGNGHTSGSTASSSHTNDTAKALTANGFAKTGHTFAGWTNTVGSAFADGQSVLNLTSVNNDTVTLYAKWTANDYTVTFLGVGSEISTYEKTVTYNSPYGELPEPEREGYDFMGWFTSVSSGVQVTPSTTVVTASDHTLYAQWAYESGNPTGDNGNDTNSNWAQHCDTDWWTKNPSAINFYIGTPEELAGFAWLVNQVTNFLGSTVYVTNDLVVTAYRESFTNELDMIAYTGSLVSPYTTYGVSESTNAPSIVTYSLDDEGFEVVTYEIDTNALDVVTYTVAVTNDFSMCAYYWTPAGMDTNCVFKGTFDGQGHTIQGISIDAVDTLQYAGLFGYVDGGTVKNVNLVDTGIVLAYNYGTVFVGGVAGYKYGGRIENCANSGTISVFSSGASVVGGVVGYNFGVGSTVLNCANDGVVEAFSYSRSYVGGVAGRNNGNDEENKSTIAHSSNYAEVFSFSCSGDSGPGSCAGGIAGYNSLEGMINHCSNDGHVSGASVGEIQSYVGGVVGDNLGTVKNSSNRGAVTAFDDYFPSYYAGGVAGRNSGNDSAIQNCSNSGEVSASHCVGGIAGWNNSSIENCMNNGEVNASSSADASGGLVGYLDGGWIKNCYWEKIEDMDGFTHNEVGVLSKGIIENSVVHFEDAPGTLDNDGFGGTKNLLTALNNWATTENNGSTAYQGWKVDVEEEVNRGYPYLAEPMPTVTFKSNDGTDTDQTVPQTHGENYVFPPDPTRAGYEFKGWFTAANGGMQVTTDLTVSLATDYTLYAHWTPVSYPITYADTKGATNPNPTAYTIEDTFVFEPLPDVEGYVFTGWDISGVDSGTTGAKTVTAQWEAITVFYVDASRPNDSGNGASWATAKRTIQAAVNLAGTGNEIVVTNGVYGPISTADKAVTIRSVNGAEHTIIDGGNMNRCATLGSLNTHTNTVLTGFTLRNGNADHTNVTVSKNYGGGSVYGTLNGCVLTNNTATSGGGGARGGTLNNCTLSHNTTTNYGGGAVQSTLNNCLLIGNTATYFGGGSHSCTLNNCTVSGNSADSGGGSNSSTLNNCIVWGNTNAVGAVNNYLGGTFLYSCTTPLPSGAGNISTDPLFVDAANGDFRLKAGSPCVGKGNNVYVVGEYDLDGNPRIANGTVNMGAYESERFAETQTTQQSVPYWWLDEKYPSNDRAYLTYETLANSKGANGYTVWESYVAGLDPTDKDSIFRIKKFSVKNVNGTDAVTVLEWNPNYENDPPPWKRDYIIEGKTNLTDAAWHSPTNSGTRFFRVKVKLP